MRTEHLAAAAGLLTAAAALAGQITLVSSFNPSEGTNINSLGYDQVAGEVFIHFNSSADYHVYAPDGTFLRTIPKPFGGGNDDDIEFLGEPAVVGGVIAPVGTLISIENENDPPTVYAVDPSDGTVLAQQTFDGPAIGQWVGGAQANGSIFYTVDWTEDEIQRVDVSSGAILGSFPVRPPGSPDFDIFYGDIDVLASDGVIYAVSSSQNTIRGLEQDGSWFVDVQVGQFGITGMAGIAFNDATGEAWIAGQDDQVHRLAGFPPPGCVIADLAPPLGILDLNDVGGFANAFIANQPVADLAEPFGLFDLSDVVAFIQAFVAGCPE